jgi:hypothetical protein
MRATMCATMCATACAAALLSAGAMAAGDKNLTDMKSWDSDSNHQITMKEWNAAIEDNALFDKVDKNNNGNFDVEEAVDHVLDYDLEMDIDAGGTISRDEFEAGLFTMHDENDDDMLDETEFMHFSANSDASPLFMTN